MATVLPSKAAMQEEPDAPELASFRLSVAALTAGNYSGPWFRVGQYARPLRHYGVVLRQYPSGLGAWPPANKFARPLWLPATIAQRIPSIVRTYAHDVTMLYREMVSTLITLEGLTHRPRVLDLDDAIWLNRGGALNFPRLVRMCDAVLCGNGFIEEQVQRWNRNTLLLPTAVDTERYFPLGRDSNARPVIGWTGVASNLKFLYAMEDALCDVLARRPDALLRVVSGEPPRFRRLPPKQVEYQPWSWENDAVSIQQMSIGLMPIEDTLWGRGKCSYKMLLYMACGLPVVVSPVGMNNEVLAQGNVGFPAVSHEQWVENLTWLLDHPAEARMMGKAGRKVVEEHYSLQLLAPRLAQFLKGVAGESRDA